MTLEELNGLEPGERGELLHRCNGSAAWVAGMQRVFPVADIAGLLVAAAEVWRACSEEDWKEAFAHHPKIGVGGGLGKWASEEQAGTIGAIREVLEDLAEGNRVYERRFGYIFIVCATGKSAVEMLRLLRERLGNEPGDELLIAMQEQEKIMRIRLEKLLS